MAINPRAPGAIYAGYAYRADFDSRNWVGGLVRSTDAGQNWTSLTTGLAYFDVRVLAIDPADRTVVYAGGAGGVFKSVDTGTSWTNLSAFRISGPPFPPDLALPPFGPGLPSFVPC